MKKLLGLALFLALIVGLVACDFAEGVDHDFGVKAEAIFLEIDEDTMEMEISDRDDISNFDLLTVEADSEREVDFLKGMEGMLKLQDKVVDGDREALKEYMRARKTAAAALGLTRNGYHALPDFQFTEDN